MGENNGGVREVKGRTAVGLLERDRTFTDHWALELLSQQSKPNKTSRLLPEISKIPNTKKFKKQIVVKKNTPLIKDKKVPGTKYVIVSQEEETQKNNVQEKIHNVDSNESIQEETYYVDSNESIQKENYIVNSNQSTQDTHTHYVDSNESVEEE